MYCKVPVASFVGVVVFTYQSTVEPNSGVAPMSTDPAVQLKPFCTSVINGNAFTVAVTATGADLQPVAVTLACA